MSPLRNLLNGVLHLALVLQWYQNNGQETKKDDTFLRKKAEEKKQCYHNDICR